MISSRCIPQHYQSRPKITGKPFQHLLNTCTTCGRDNFVTKCSFLRYSAKLALSKALTSLLEMSILDGPDLSHSTDREKVGRKRLGPRRIQIHDLLILRRVLYRCATTAAYFSATYISFRIFWKEFSFFKKERISIRLVWFPFSCH